MLSWYLATYKYKEFQVVSEHIEPLNVEMYAPVRFTQKRRSDSSGHRTKQSQIFPGYIFLRLDPEKVHTSVITNLPGVKEFVRIGKDICTISDALMDALKSALLIRTNTKVTAIEFGNAPPELVEKIQAIALIKCALARQSEFFNLLQDDLVKQKLNNRYSCILTLIENPAVDDLLE